MAASYNSFPCACFIVTVIPRRLLAPICLTIKDVEQENLLYLYMRQLVVVFSEQTGNPVFECQDAFQGAVPVNDVLVAENFKYGISSDSLYCPENKVVPEFPRLRLLTHVSCYRQSSTILTEGFPHR